MIYQKRTKGIDVYRRFDVIDEQSAYWLGFLAADGWVTSYGTVGCGLQSRDVEHLKKLQQYISPNAKITFYPNTNSYTFTVQCKELVRDLKQWHIVPRKSLTYSPPVNLLSNRHFWRGYVDGDGCVQINRNRGFIGLTGTRDTISSFVDWCVSLDSCIKYKEPNEYKSVFNVRYSCTPAEIIIKALYENSNISLDRKSVILSEIGRK